MSYHIEYIPQTHVRTKHSKGNGGNIGCGAGHKQKSLNNKGSFLYGNGCLRHNCTDCFKCPRYELGLDCDWDYMVEYELRKKQNEKNTNE